MGDGRDTLILAPIPSQSAPGVGDCRAKYSIGGCLRDDAGQRSDSAGGGYSGLMMLSMESTKRADWSGSGAPSRKQARNL